jgi:RNA polymerase sigma-70 factor (ECF subfamily)
MHLEIERVFRSEYGRIIASLIRLSGSFDLAEDAMQEAFLAALNAWQAGLPENPGAWIQTTARRKLIDRLRRAARQQSLESGGEASAAPFMIQDTNEMFWAERDDRLRLIFTCCHPALARETQVALTLRTLCGLTTANIARAFLVPEATMAQRLVRAKHKIRVANIPYREPAPDLLPERLETVLAVVYLIFNEGYAATLGEALIRQDLCEEAIRLARLVLELIPDEAEAEGLLALLLLQNSRSRARTGQHGELLTLDRQDRSLWDRAQIEKGEALIERALLRRKPGPYQLQAAIAAVHAQAQRAEDTDWAEIVALYAALYRLQPSPIVRLNQAVAVAMAFGYDRGLSVMDDLAQAGELDDYYMLHASRADLLRRLGRNDEARIAYERALQLTQNSVEQTFLRERISGLAT